MDYYKLWLEKYEKYQREHSPEELRDFPDFDAWMEELRYDSMEWEET